MALLRTILKVVAYSKFPKTAFALTHPQKAANLAKTGYDLKHAWAPRLAAAGAVLLALPLGYAIGRMVGASKRGEDWPQREPETDYRTKHPEPAVRGRVWSETVDGDVRTDLVGLPIE